MFFAAVILVGASACKEEGGVKVTSFSFNGTRAVSEGQLKSVLATAGSSKLPWGEKHYFQREQFEADLKRIVAFYQDRGYPDARVTSFDVKLNEDQTSVKIAINIDEGQPTVVERLELQGFDQALRPEALRAIETGLPLKAGQPLDRALFQANREYALDALRDRGYPYAAVRLSEAQGASERQRVVTLRAEPGTQARYGEIEVAGNSSVSDNVIRRQLTFRPGQLYRQSRMEESQRRLYNLELFQFANVEPVREGQGQPPVIPTRVTVTEGKHRKVNFSVGYGSEEKARAEIDWRHVNFFGGARTGGVQARYSGLDRGVRLQFTQPYLFSPRWSFNASGQSWYSDEPAYKLTTTGGRVGVTRQFARGGGPRTRTRPTMTLALTYANEYEDYTVSEEALNDPTFRDDLIALGLNPETGRGTGTRSALIVDAGRNTADNVLDARRGYVAALHLEQAGKWLGGSYHYYELTTEGRYYQAIGRRAVVAVQGRLGAIDGFGDQDASVPFFKRYFLGGAANLRGWGRFEISPLTESGQPIGGATFLSTSVELRAPLWRKLGGVIFVDAGNVWTDPWNVDLGDLRVDVGPGLRYDTPIGPLRVDLGYQLNPIPGLLVNGEPQARRFRFHFSIGQAF
jgi:outer membrane protein insertion porin family/translocation and assembly module TamA